MRGLMFSNSLFLIPTIYGFRKQQYMLSTINLITTIASLHYWREPLPGAIKNLDLAISKLAGIAYFWYGYNHLDNIHIRLAGYVNGACMLLLYHASCNTYARCLAHWKYYHMAFHVSVAIGQMLILSNEPTV